MGLYIGNGNCTVVGGNLIHDCGNPRLWLNFVIYFGVEFKLERFYNVAQFNANFQTVSLCGRFFFPPHHFRTEL